MMHVLLYSLLAAVTVSASVKNSPKVYRYASKSHAVEVEAGKEMRIKTLGANGKVTAEQVYPFDQEMVLADDDSLCNAELVADRPSVIATRIAIVSGYRIAFLQTERVRRSEEDLSEPLPEFLKNYSSYPFTFIHGVLTFDQKGDVVNLEINSISDPAYTLKLTAAELLSPFLFTDVDSAFYIHRALKGYPDYPDGPAAKSVRIKVNDILYNSTIQGRYDAPVKREGAPENHTTAHLVGGRREPHPRSPLWASRSSRSDSLPPDDPLAPYDPSRPRKDRVKAAQAEMEKRGLPRKPSNK